MHGFHDQDRKDDPAGIISFGAWVVKTIQCYLGSLLMDSTLGTRTQLKVLIRLGRVVYLNQVCIMSRLPLFFIETLMYP